MTDTLYIDWLDSLAILRGTIGVSEISKIIERTALRWGSPTEVGISIHSITFKPAEGFTGRPRRAVAVINPRIEPLYKVERTECLLRVALRVYQYYIEANDYRMAPFYEALGVYASPLYDPKTRWQHLGMKYHRGEVAASRYEDRPVCPICHIHVSSGHENPKIHDGCREYVRNVYAPALRAQQQAVKV